MVSPGCALCAYPGYGSGNGILSMSEKLSSIVWDWYATDERKDVLALCDLCEALEFLSAGAAHQMANIPDCPACETWTEMVMPIESFLKSCPRSVPQDVRDALDHLWTSCNSLGESAFHCWDVEIFLDPEWDGIRTQAAAALELIDWQSFKADAGVLAIECRMVLYPHRYPG